VTDPGLRHFRRQRGFTMIEVLIAFILLSVGLLGVVSLQGMAKTNQHQAMQRARAIALADMMLERIRINPSEAGDIYNISDIGLDGSATAYLASAPKDCRVAACTTNELAVRDLWEWNEDIGGRGVTSGASAVAGLIEPRACIYFDSMAGRNDTGVVEILITWNGLLELQGDWTGRACGDDDDPKRRRVSVTSWVIDEAEL
jgi:type IV pilus assembly protein PilV